jgi:hypothetical protein
MTESHGRVTDCRAAPYPPYSPDLALSGVFFFGHFKNGLQGQQFGSADELLSEVRELLDEINIDILEAILREWIIRLDR